MTELKDEVQVFNKGEIVLCYEPDKSKKRVLYTSKVCTHIDSNTTHTHGPNVRQMSDEKGAFDFSAN